ncbi:hypothetical protein KC19_4G001600 [Ceratodon purpureus]|uniref:Uncharacterized protein n=1 Tax=Ceratodon purpureus TaxID=3225 RepID=A0A8T0I6K4_CERPU|nr:hypothetical protein KC19_4G001600 [Ceratodon purpureus]
MRREEPPEDRKLLAVKSWFTRSLSSISSQNGSVENTLDGNSSSISMSKEGVVESGPGFTPLRQLSMRRSRPSGEIEKESGAGSPCMTPRNITPLTPLTPLRWKSNPREQEEEKAMERSRLGSAVSNGMPHEEYLGGKLVANNEKEERLAEGQQEGAPAAEFAALDRTKSVDELSTKAQAGNIDEIVSHEFPEGPDRKPTSGDDVMTMTIEFLRARLLSERSASKAAKSRVQQLATKVFELEQKLDHAIEDRKKAELAAHEALAKFKLAENSNQMTDRTSGEVSDRSISNSTKGSPLSRSRTGREDTKYLLQEMSSNEDLSRTNSYGSSVEDRDSSTKKQLPEIVSKIEGHRAESGLPGVRPSLQNTSERNQESPQKQDSRAAIESRLRNMWNKISEEMAALAEERSEEDAVREELMSWMGQVPTVLQDIIPRPLPQILQDNGQLQTNPKRTALLQEQFAAQETVQQEWERNYHESRRKLEQLKGNDRKADRSPNGRLEHQHADHLHGPNGIADGSSFLGSHHARIAKSKSALDLPAKPNGYNSETNSSYHEGPHIESDSWNRDRSRRQGSDSRQQNLPAHGLMLLEHTHLNHSRVHRDRSAAPLTLQEAGPEAWSDRQVDQEAGVYYQDTDNRSEWACVEGGRPDRAQWPSNRSAEDGFRNPQPDFRAGQPTWDDGDRRNSGRDQEAQPGYGDDIGRLERESYYRDSEREEPYNSSQPESTPKHRHRRSRSDNSDWPAVEEYGMPNQIPEQSPSPGLGRRQQSYTGFPAGMTSDVSRSLSSRDKAPGIGANGDPRFIDERMYGTNVRGHRRESYPASKADHVSGPPYSTHPGRNSYSNAEPTLTLGYGPAYDAPREGSPVQQSPKAGINKNISDVLRALQMAKANIQNGGAGSQEQRFSGEQSSLKTGYGMDPPAQYMQAPRQPTPEHLRYFESQAPLSKPSRPVSHDARYDRYDADFGRERYQPEGDAINGTNANSSYVDQLNVGKGIQFFFP